MINVIKKGVLFILFITLNVSCITDDDLPETDYEYERAQVSRVEEENGSDYNAFEFFYHFAKIFK